MYRNRRGSVLVISAIVMLIVAIIAGAYLSTVVFQKKLTIRSYRLSAARNLAESGIQTALWELGFGQGSWVGWDTSGAVYTKTILSFQTQGGKVIGDYIISVSNLTSASATISATGYAPNMTNIDKVERTVKVDAERIGNPGVVNSALQAGGNVLVSGNGLIDGDTSTGVTIPAGFTATTAGSGEITGSPPVSNAAFPSIEDIFGLTKEEMEGISTRNYTDPPNNSDVDGITWVKFQDNSSFKITTTGWYGSGILIVDGDIDIAGGTFEGIIYVLGNLTITGNPEISGSVLVQTQADTSATISTGRPLVVYNSVNVANAFANNLPWRIVSGSWQEY
ncbi:hypothetical protein KKC91_02055 [bacterium]|nr:hypothetical protein [bacterium]